jgi:hypothetical protein
MNNQCFGTPGFRVFLGWNNTFIDDKNYRVFGSEHSTNKILTDTYSTFERRFNCYFE